MAKSEPSLEGPHCLPLWFTNAAAKEDTYLVSDDQAPATVAPV